jgi:hypothetical protein
MILEFIIFSEKSDMHKNINSNNINLYIDRIVDHIKYLFRQELNKIYQDYFPTDHIQTLESSLVFDKFINNTLVFNLDESGFLEKYNGDQFYEYMEQNSVLLNKHAIDLSYKFQNLQDDFIYDTNNYIIDINKDRRRI